MNENPGENPCDGCGQASSCNQESCGESPEEQKLKAAVSRIKHKLVVMSGKGGVGKTTMAVNLAVGLSLRGYTVGLLDVDVHGPSVPRALSMKDAKPHMEPDHMEPVPYSKNLSVMSLGFLMPSGDEAVIWRGPVKQGLIRQFLSDVSWHDLDFLVVDCPPGTGDEPLSVLQMLGPEAKAVIVTTPQYLAVDDVRRSVTFCRELGNPILGVVENMAGFVCTDCGSTQHLFGRDGGKVLAAQTGETLLGSLPLDPEVVRSVDQGYPIAKVLKEGPTAEALKEVIDGVLAGVGEEEVKT